jgi:U3 small nucleolar ribonucleoprotein protein IMP3
MVRKLQYHEQRLLRKVDFYEWDKNDNIRESHVMRRYHIQRREDYVVLNRICGQICKLANELGLLPEDDPCRQKLSMLLYKRLHGMGLIIEDRPERLPLKDIPTVATVAALARRRLAVVMVAKLKMSETVKEATTLVEQGHVRIGPDTVRDPGVLLTRAMEDFVTWTDGSKIKRRIDEYYGHADDFDDI